MSASKRQSHQLPFVDARNAGCPDNKYMGYFNVFAVV
jgi:hypothetical protein